MWHRRQRLQKARVPGVEERDLLPLGIMGVVWARLWTAVRKVGQKRVVGSSVLLPKSEWLGDARVGVGREVLVPDFGAVGAIGRCDAAKRTLDTSPLFLLVMMDPTKNIFVLFCRAGGAMKRAADTQRRWRRVATDAGVPRAAGCPPKLPVAARRPLSKTSRPPSNAPTALRRRVTSPRNRAPPRPKKRGIRQEGRSSCAGWHFGTPMARDAVNTRVFASRKVAMR